MRPNITSCLASLKDDAEKLNLWTLYSSESTFLLMKCEKIRNKDAVQENK